MTDFDLYCAPPGFRPVAGERVSLDGIDGFFDQYFEGRETGEAIRFLCYPCGDRPRDPDRFADLPFVSAHIVEADPLGGTVEVTRVIPFGSWLGELPPQTAMSAGELADRTGVAVAALIGRALQDGVAAWVSTAKYWKHLDQLTAIYATNARGRIRVAVLHTNAVPAWVADVMAQS